MKDFLGIKPKSNADYVFIGNWMIAKKLLMLLMMLLCMFMIIGFTWISKTVETFTEEKRFYYNEPFLEKYSGVATILKRIEDKDQVIYQGEIKDGVCTGKGKVFDLKGNLVYEGFLENNYFEGKGKLYQPAHKLIYEGSFSHNKYNGEGILYEGYKGRYEGSFVEGVKEGKGKFYNSLNQLIYQGEFVKGKYEGVGTLYNGVTGEWYTGSFKAGVKEGQGVLYNKDDKVIFEGTYTRDHFSGEAMRYWYTHKMYVGNYVNGQREGYGKEYNIKGKLVYEGMLSLGKRHGEGKEYDGIQNRKIYEGQFLEGERHGKGTLYNTMGKVLVQGQFFQGQVDYSTYLEEDVEGLKQVFQEIPQEIDVSSQKAYWYAETGIITETVEATESGTQEEQPAEGKTTSTGSKVVQILVLNPLNELPANATLMEEGVKLLDLVHDIEGYAIREAIISDKEKESIELYKKSYETDNLHYELLFESKQATKPLYYKISRKGGE